jgi:hypothetical protein
MADAFKSNWRRVKGEGFMRRMLSPSDLEHYQKGAYTVCLEEFEFRSPTTASGRIEPVGLSGTRDPRADGRDRLCRCGKAAI